MYSVTLARVVIDIRSVHLRASLACGAIAVSLFHILLRAPSLPLPFCLSPESCVVSCCHCLCRLLAQPIAQTFVINFFRYRSLAAGGCAACSGRLDPHAASYRLSLLLSFAMADYPRGTPAAPDLGVIAPHPWSISRILGPPELAPTSSPEPAAKRRRTAPCPDGCTWCRKKKIKCSGRPRDAGPCANCSRDSLQCSFVAGPGQSASFAPRCPQLMFAHLF